LAALSATCLIVARRSPIIRSKATPSRSFWDGGSPVHSNRRRQSYPPPHISSGSDDLSGKPLLLANLSSRLKSTVCEISPSATLCNGGNLQDGTGNGRPLSSIARTKTSAAATTTRSRPPNEQRTRSEHFTRFLLHHQSPIHIRQQALGAKDLLSAIAFVLFDAGGCRPALPGAHRLHLVLQFRNAL
jgi:hypothetical protein